MHARRRATLSALLPLAARRPLQVAAALGFAYAGASAPARADTEATRNAGPYVPSPDSVVARMLDLAEVGPSDVLIDMGSGDGRIVLGAATLRGARGLGIEIDEALVAQSIESARRQGVADRARFVRQDLFRTDVSGATVITLYLLPATVNQVADKLRHELRPGTRVLSHDYPIAGWLPETWKEFEEPEKRKATGIPTATIYLYRVPAAVGGRWQLALPAELGRTRVTIDLRQQWQKLDGMATVGGREQPLEDVTLRGERVGFRLALEGTRTAAFEGLARDGSIEGTLRLGDASLPWRATPLR